jgi:hypothetical protein
LLDSETAEKAWTLTHRLPHCGVDKRRGGLFDDLLVAALDRTLALRQREVVAVLVTKHLDLNVPTCRSQTPRRPVSEQEDVAQEDVRKGCCLIVVEDVKGVVAGMKVVKWRRIAVKEEQEEEQDGERCHSSRCWNNEERVIVGHSSKCWNNEERVIVQRGKVHMPLYGQT